MPARTQRSLRETLGFLLAPVCKLDADCNLMVFREVSRANALRVVVRTRYLPGDEFDTVHILVDDISFDTFSATGLILLTSFQLASLRPSILLNYCMFGKEPDRGGFKIHFR